MKLYTVVEAIPSRVLGLARFLQSQGRRAVTRAEAVSLLQPPSLRKGADGDPDMSNKVLGAARELGLVEEYEDERGESCLRLSPVAREAAQGDGAPRERWARFVARRVMRDLAADVSRDLATICAWLTTLRAAETPADKAAWKDRFRGDGFELDAFGLNNDARWDNLFDWTQFIGLTWQTNSDRTASGIVVDPAALIARFLDELFPEAGEIEAAEFRRRLGEVLAPLDGGALHREVRAKVAAARGAGSDPAERWSPGVSMAVRELRDRGLLHYHCPNDQRTFLLLDPDEKIAFVSRAGRARR